MTTTIMEGAPMNERHFVGDSNALPQRKKLQLKPRSERAPERARRRSTSARGDPFGSAKPREEVLKERGIDVEAVDQRIEKKAAVLSFTPDQEIQVEGVRAELTKVEALLRDANENELPEEAFRVQVEAKREELNSLMEKFSNMNEKGGGVVKKDDVQMMGKDRRRSPRVGNFPKPMMALGSNRKPWNDAK